MLQSFFNSKKTISLSLFFFLLFSSFLFLSCNTEYKTTLKKAEQLLKEKKYSEAKIYFTKAFKLNNKEKYPQGKIKEIEKLLTKINDSIYLKNITDADVFFNNKEYKKAKQAYTKATQLKPDEEYSKTMIDEINQEINTQNKNNLNNTDTHKYQIIAGSYRIESGAKRAKIEFLKTYEETKIITSRWNGNFLVSITSFSTIHKAYNFLEKNRSLFNQEIWVYRK